MFSADPQREVAELLLRCGCGTVPHPGMQVGSLWLPGPPVGVFRRLAIVDAGPQGEPIYGDMVFDVGSHAVTVWNCRNGTTTSARRRVRIEEALRALRGSQYAVSALGG